MEEKVLEWIGINDVRFYIISSVGGEKMTIRRNETADASKETFQTDVALLPPGRYKISGGPNKTDGTGGVKFAFTVGGNDVKTVTKNEKEMSPTELRELLNDAYERGQKEEQIRSLERRVTALELALEKQKEKINELLTAFNANNDDDPKNDVTEMIMPIVQAGGVKLIENFKL